MVEAQPRVNQLPVDEANGRSERGRVSFERAPIASPSTVRDTVTAMVVLLFRHTYQPEVSVDVRLPGADKFVHVALPISADVPLTTLANDVQRALESAPERSGALSSNVAIDWVGDCSEPFELVLEPGDGEKWVYADGRYKRSTIERLANNWDAIKRQLGTPLGTLGHLEFLQEQERAVVAPPMRKHAGPALRPVHEDIDRQAETRALEPAVLFGTTVLTYEALRTRSNQLARRLQAEGVGVGDRVSVCLGPRVEQIIAMVAIFKLGAIYVPLDPTHPPALVEFILSEAEPKAVLAEPTLSGVTFPESCTRLDVDQVARELAALSDAPLGIDVQLNQTCYILFTSGTTGQPKGAMASHENLAHYLRAACQAYGFSPTDTFCSIARYTFSISMFELMCPLVVGGCVRLLRRDDVLRPDFFSSILNEVTVLHAGPSLLSSLFRYLEENGKTTFPGVRHASSGGDLVGPHIMEGLKRTFPNAELFVIYGCTEISCMGCTYPIPRDAAATRNFVGKPFPDVAVRIVDLNGHLVPIGVVGEIWFAGLGVVPGYLERPELNETKFVTFEGIRYYRTGDMGRFDEDGNVEMLGRQDFQVQVRGMRVELAGIENTIRRLGLAAQCAATMKRIDDRDARLVVFVEKPTEPADAIRRHLGEHLPDYMVPQHVIVVDSLPLSPNGKLDRLALAQLPWQLQTSPSPHKPGVKLNRIEQQIAVAFATALGVANCGLDDDFFDMGGHSLLAVQVAEELRNVLGLSVSAGALFEAPTVRKLVEHLTSFEESSHRPILLTRTPADRKLFLIAGVHIYRELAKRLEGKYSVFGVYAGAELNLFDENAKAAPVPELARKYIEVIQREQSAGEYYIAGMSFGGIVAYEVACQLKAMGSRVKFIGMFDAMLPGHGLMGQLDRARRFSRLKPKTAVNLLVSKAKDRLNARRAEYRAHAEGQLAQMELFREDSYRESALAYAPMVADIGIPVTLIVAGKRLAEEPISDPLCGWSRTVSSLNAERVDADHLGLLQEPGVGEVARIVLGACT